MRAFGENEGFGIERCLGETGFSREEVLVLDNKCNFLAKVWCDAVDVMCLVNDTAQHQESRESNVQGWGA